MVLHVQYHQSGSIAKPTGELKEKSIIHCGDFSSYVSIVRVGGIVQVF